MDFPSNLVISKGSLAGMAIQPRLCKIGSLVSVDKFGRWLSEYGWEYEMQFQKILKTPYDNVVILLKETMHVVHMYVVSNIVAM